MTRLEKIAKLTRDVTRLSRMMNHKPPHGELSSIERQELQCEIDRKVTEYRRVYRNKHAWLAFALALGSPAAYAASQSVQLDITVLPSGSGGPDMFQQQLLNLINTSRAGGGLPPYTFSAVMSNGTGSCIGSIGNSESMAQMGALNNHDLFPGDVCATWSSAGENEGWWSGVSEAQAIINIHNSMMAEGPSGGHYQNIMSSSFTTVGLGLVVDHNGVTWLTEDFVQP